MAHTIKLGNFTKHEESTARPNTTGWAEYSVTFKEGADIVNPTITISAASSTVTGYNYGVMNGRYYWIRGINLLRNGLAVLDLETDVLATYKTLIGNETLYILRAAAAMDGTIKDNYYPPKAKATHITEYESAQDVPLDYSNGYYLVNIAGTQTGNGTLIQLDPTNYVKLIKNLYTQIDGYTPGDIIEKVVQHFGGNPQGLISSVMWFPFPFVTSDNSDAVYIGSWLSGAVGDIVTNPLQIKTSLSFTINKHPKAASRGAYLNAAPYMNYALYLPGAGAVNLDTTKLLNDTSINVYRLVDGFTGQIKYMVMAGSSTNEHVLANVTGQYGVPIRIAGDSTGNSVISGITGNLGSALLAAVTGSAGAAIGALTGGIGTVADAMGGAAYSNETGGGIVNLYQQPVRLDTTYYDIPDELNSKIGRPYCKSAKPSTLNGYMIVAHGDVEIDGTITEQRKIKQYLETGFYYE